MEFILEGSSTIIEYVIVRTLVGNPPQIYEKKQHEIVNFLFLPEIKFSSYSTEPKSKSNDKYSEEGYVQHSQIWNQNSYCCQGLIWK